MYLVCVFVFTVSSHISRPLSATWSKTGESLVGGEGEGWVTVIQHVRI